MAQEWIVKILWKRGAIRLLPAITLFSLGFGIIFPIIPSLATNYFASQAAGHSINCEQVETAAPHSAVPGQAPQYDPDSDAAACHNAHSTAVYWSSTTSFFSNSIVAFLVAPMLGDLSDRLGRKPLLMLGFFLSCLPVVTLFLFLHDVLPFYWFYIANSVSNTNAVLSGSCAYMADVLDGPQRATGFGLIIAVMFVGFSLGPQVALVLSEAASCVAGLTALALAMVYVLVCVNETLPPDAKARAQKEPLTFRSLGTFKLFAFLGRSSLFIKLATCLAILGVVQEGLQDMLIQYLQLKVDFRMVDQGTLFSVMGVCNLVVQTVVVSYAVAWVGEQRMLVIGLVFFMVYQLMLGLVTSKLVSFVAVGVGSLSMVTFPAISSIKANNCSDDEQGMLQGALAGLRAVAQGIGPLLFAFLFSIFTRTDSTLPYIPGVPFFFGCILTIGALAVACTIHPKAGQGWKHLSDAGPANNKDLAPFGRTSAGVGQNDAEGWEQDLGEVRVGLLAGLVGEEEGVEERRNHELRLEATLVAAAEQIPSIEHP